MGFFPDGYVRKHLGSVASRLPGYSRTSAVTKTVDPASRDLESGASALGDLDLGGPASGAPMAAHAGRDGVFQTLPTAQTR